MAEFKNISHVTVVFTRRTILPDAIFSDDKYTEEEKNIVQKLVAQGKFSAVAAKVEEASATPVVEEAAPVAEETTTTKKKSSKARG